MSFGQQQLLELIRLCLDRLCVDEAYSTERGTTMKNFAKSVKRFLASEDGPTAVEYAVMLALIVIVCLTAIQAIGTNANTKFGEVGTALAGGS